MYKKNATTVEQQIALLKERGLLINPEDNAAHWLSHISYYRLGEYWHSMQEQKRGACF